MPDPKPEATEEFATEEEIQRARDLYGTDDIEIDDFNVKASRIDNGVWVQAWVWLENEEEEG